MESLKTPDRFSETMSIAYNISENNRNIKRIRDEDLARESSARYFQVAAWDPCYNLESTDFLRGSDFKTGSKSGSIRVKGNPNSELYPKHDYIDGTNSSISAYPCEAPNVAKQFQTCTSAKSRLGLRES